LITARTVGLEHLQRGRLPEAEQEFRQVIALAPRDPLGYANLGLTYLRAARYAEAESELDRARRLDPKNPDIALIVAKLYSLTGRPAEARRILSAVPADARVLYALAELDREGGDSAYAERLRVPWWLWLPVLALAAGLAAASTILPNALSAAVHTATRGRRAARACR